MIDLDQIELELEVEHTNPQKILRKEIGVRIAFDILNRAEATRIFLFLDCYKHIPTEKQVLFPSLALVLQKTCKHSKKIRKDFCWHSMYRASQVAQILAEFYSEHEQLLILQEIQGRKLLDRPLDNLPEFR